MPVAGKTIFLVNEEYRTYFWPDGTQVRITDVTEVIPTETTHRLKSVGIEGVRLHIIPSGWNHIEIKSFEDDWEA